MRSDLQILNDKLDKILFILEAKPLARPADRRQGASAKGQALAEHDEKWAKVKAEWPEFRVHPKACEAFEKHVKSLGDKATPQTVRKLAERLKAGRYYTRQTLEAEMSLTYEKAQAYIYLIRMAGFGKWIDKKGLLITAETEYNSGVEE